MPKSWSTLASTNVFDSCPHYPIPNDMYGATDRFPLLKMDFSTFRTHAWDELPVVAQAVERGASDGAGSQDIFTTAQDWADIQCNEDEGTRLEILWPVKEVLAKGKDVRKEPDGTLLRKGMSLALSTVMHGFLVRHKKKSRLNSSMALEVKSRAMQAQMREDGGMAWEVKC